ncbi:P-loop containing nucleoside triphosphate hydrolase protein [Mytilinidion resinicola]|uniref:P-loop containing nucleoside triphosphate hydrolase protein n=1 Tax=Mytilinidion resinicola TaxID=574789 RepID=A0A6A6YS56_9PEZI|nr:P-loop containing nucleoside triphosphate hydrolase protein [Mytilinidion resinicola]KAF2811611.1 P-loop containing nucleoside triphosphate hydrolase protein [Mytilinidion resinicola]
MFSSKRLVQYKAALKDQFEKRQRSLAIDRSLKRDWNRRVQSEYNILLLGADHKGKKEIMEVVRGFYEDTYTTDELAGYRLTIYKILIDSVKALVSAMDKSGIVPDSNENKSYCAYLKSFAVPPADPQKPLEPKVGEAIAALRTDRFINSAQRIASPDYLPTPADISRTRTTDSFLARYSMYNTISMCDLSIRLFDSGSARRRSRKWAECLETTAQMVIFVVDLAYYDEPLFDDNSFTRMTDMLALWERTVKSRWHERMPFVLFLNNADEFKAKLGRSPLADYFPDYAGGNDHYSASRYLIERFEGIIDHERNDYMYAMFTLSSNATQLRDVFIAVAVLINKSFSHVAGF